MTRQAPGTPEEYLRRADDALGAVIEEVVRDGGRPTLGPDAALPPDPNMPTDRYGVLVRAIVSQNISEISSRSIYSRLIERFGGRPPEPQEILDVDPDELRTPVGLSRAKVAALRSLAEHIVSGELALERLHELPDEDVIAQLVSVKGIGTWTADIFLIFHLRRPDVLPGGDIADVERIAEPWRPHRTLASLYLWRTVEATPQV